ncbi:C-type lectin 1 [Amphibalanus amphitrite]|uniref:C-type lectin 1 n=1 Tax=Amphibalanus amphitrite TaxID=1232801 RepID=A0A6A4X2V2_AMPAM|nr:C-type lectin 1 [Amphibalanus amphitrite]
MDMTYDVQAHRDCALLHRRAGLASVHPGSAGHLRDVLAATQVRAAWVGLTRLAGRGSGWVWSDGSTLDTAKWAPRSPSNYGSGQKHCVLMRADRSGSWVDDKCDKVEHFVCQVWLK